MASGTIAAALTLLWAAQTVYGARKVAQKFWPYTDFVLAQRTREAATERQLRLLGVHPISNYG